MKQSQKQIVIQLPKLIVNDPAIWSYHQNDAQELEAYFQQNIAFFQSIPKTNIIDGYQCVVQHLKLPPHPLLQQRFNRSAQSQQNLLGEQSIDSIKNTQEMMQFLVLQNTLLDTYTLKILQALWPIYPNLTVLKIYNITFSQEEMNIIQKIIADNKIIKLFIEYSNILPIINSQTLNQLYLRGNNITPSKLRDFLENSKFPNISGIDLSDNPLGKHGIHSLSQLLSTKNNIQYLGLSKIDISSWDDLKHLLEQIGVEKLSEQKLAQYREQEEKRDKQIKEQLKSKKKDIVAEIQLEPLIPLPDGSFGIQKNAQLQVIYLAMNPFKDNDKDSIEKAATQNPNIQFILQGSQIDKKNQEKMKKKCVNIIF